MNRLIRIDFIGENECMEPKMMNYQMQQKQQQPKWSKMRIKRIIAHTKQSKQLLEKIEAKKDHLCVNVVPATWTCA